MKTLEDWQFSFLRDLVAERSGITLGVDKRFGTERRLAQMAHEEGLRSASELVTRIRDAGSGPLVDRLVDRMTNNETLFFRDPAAFRSVEREVVPQLIEARAAQRSLKVWSAACSTGQEPYSLAMMLRDAFPQLAGWRISILATDICRRALGRAESGLYTDLECTRGLSAAQRKAHFKRGPEGMQISSDLRKLISFRPMNLSARWPFLPPQDLILLRNVLIYFGDDTRTEILRRAAGRLAPGGYLVLGAGETYPIEGLERVRLLGSSVYRRPPAQPRRATGT